MFIIDVLDIAFVEMTSGSDFLRKMSLLLNEYRKEVELKDKTKFTRQRKQSVDEQQNKSAVTDHVVKENHVIGWDEASILGREGNRSARWIRESIEIRKQDIQGHTMNRHIPCHISTTHFSPQQRHLAEKIGTDKGKRCCRNVNNEQERLDLDLLKNDTQQRTAALR